MESFDFEPMLSGRARASARKVYQWRLREQDGVDEETALAQTDELVHGLPSSADLTPEQNEAALDILERAGVRLEIKKDLRSFATEDVI